MDLPQNFNKLRQELQIFLNFTEESLNISQERFKQAQSVLKPWPNLKTESSEVDCLCNSVEITENPEDLVLIDNISKVLTNAQKIRSKTTLQQNKTDLKSNTKTYTHNKLVKTVKTCSKLHNQKTTKLVTNKSSSAQSITNKDTHKPTCPLYNQEIVNNKPFLTISEALLIYKTPLILTKTLQNCTKMMNVSSTKNKSKDKFFALFNTQNENLWISYEKNHTSVLVLTKYITTYHEFKRKTQIEMCPWLLLNNELQNCLDSKLIIKEFWNGILNCIVDLIPILDNAELEMRQELYIFKLIKTICNLVHCNVLKVPIFRLK